MIRKLDGEWQFSNTFVLALGGMDIWNAAQKRDCTSESKCKCSIPSQRLRNHLCGNIPDTYRQQNANLLCGYISVFYDSKHLSSCFWCLDGKRRKPNKSFQILIPKSHKIQGPKNSCSNPKCGPNKKEAHSEEGAWVSAGRLTQLVGELEAAELMEELESKRDERTGRVLWFYCEEKLSHKALEEPQTHIPGNHLSLGKVSLGCQRGAWVLIRQNNQAIKHKGEIKTYSTCSQESNHSINFCQVQTQGRKTQKQKQNIDHPFLGKQPFSRMSANWQTFFWDGPGWEALFLNHFFSKKSVSCLQGFLSGMYATSNIWFCIP